MNRQKGFGVVEIILIIIVIALLGFLGYWVYQSQVKTQNATNTNEPNTPPPTQPTVVEEPTYKVTIPVGWNKVQTAPNEYVATLASSVMQPNGYSRYYQDEKGNYFTVIVDPGGRGYEADETWTFTNTATGFRFESRVECEGVFCTPAGANEYRIGMKTSGKLDGHDYFFFAGNSKQKTGVDTDVFKTIAESIVMR